MLQTQTTQDESSINNVPIAGSIVNTVELLFDKTKQNFNSADELHRAYKDAGLIISDNEAIEFFNQSKRPYIKPALKSKFHKKYNERKLLVFNNYQEFVTRIFSIKTNINIFKQLSANRNWDEQKREDYEIFNKNISLLTNDNPENVYQFIQIVSETRINNLYECLNKIINCKGDIGLEDTKNINDIVVDAVVVQEQPATPHRAANPAARKANVTHIKTRSGSELDVEEEDTPTRQRPLTEPDDPETKHQNELRYLAKKEELAEVLESIIANPSKANPERNKLMSAIFGKLSVIDLSSDAYEAQYTFTSEELTRITNGSIDEDINTILKYYKQN